MLRCFQMCSPYQTNKQKQSINYCYFQFQFFAVSFVRMKKIPQFAINFLKIAAEKWKEDREEG